MLGHLLKLCRVKDFHLFSGAVDKVNAVIGVFVYLFNDAVEVIGCFDFGICGTNFFVCFFLVPVHPVHVIPLSAAGRLCVIGLYIAQSRSFRKGQRCACFLRCHDTKENRFQFLQSKMCCPRCPLSCKPFCTCQFLRLSLLRSQSHSG